MSLRTLLVFLLAIGIGTAPVVLRAAETVSRHVLGNGLQVIIAPLHDQPRVEVIVAAHVGSKQDPPDATGLAHYLEHMLFKGTDRLGTTDYAAERPLLDTIEMLYERYRATTDPAERRRLYGRIDAVSGEASRYAVANEYDRLVQALGCTGTNAFTSSDVTAYHSDVPSNRLAAFLALDAERFRAPVLRLFHTELESVYEEKNISMDSDGDLVYDTLMRALFPHHPYGTQSTLGTTEHLKNPSMRRIREHYRQYYVAGNMSIILSGDVDTTVLPLLEATFGRLPAGTAPAWTKPVVTAPRKPIVREVSGPDPAAVSIGYLLPAPTDSVMPALRMLDLVLANGKTGLIDIDLDQAQLVIEPVSFFEYMKDYTVHHLEGRPMPGGRLDEVRNLLLDQITRVVYGYVERGVLPAIVMNQRKDRARTLQSYQGTGFMILDHLSRGLPWDYHTYDLDLLAAVTTDDVIDAANRYYTGGYVLVNKIEGERQDYRTVEKPPITAVAIRREAESDFARTILRQPAADVAPRFADWSRDIVRRTLAPDVAVAAVRDTSTTLFACTYVLPVGYRQDSLLGVAMGWASMLGTTRMSPKDRNMRQYGLALDMDVIVGPNETMIHCSGLDERFTDAMALVDSLLTLSYGERPSMESYVGRILHERQNARNDDGALVRAMNDLATYGTDNPTLAQPKASTLEALTVDSLIPRIRSVFQWPHRILYAGPSSIDTVLARLRAAHTIPVERRARPLPRPFTVRPLDAPAVYTMERPMVQAQVGIVGRSAPRWSIDNGVAATLFNEYYDGGMGSIVFQTLREAKGLAYGASARLLPPGDTTTPFRLAASIGTQADKLGDALEALTDLLRNPPEHPDAFAAAKAACRQRLIMDRQRGMDILLSEHAARWLGLTANPQPAILAGLTETSLSDVLDFYDGNGMEAPLTVTILAPAAALDNDVLGQYGTVQRLTPDDVLPR